jgi:methylmalonyl-CoA/ethylmalonyl-CoA epimerase
MRRKTVAELMSRFHHLGVVVRNMEGAVEYLHSLGMGPFESSNLVHINRKMEGKPVAGDVKIIVKAGMLGPIWIEFLQPVSGVSTPGEWLEHHGEGISHMAFIVDNIKEAKSVMGDAGFALIYSSDNQGGGGMAFFSNEKLGGLIIEMEELPSQLDKDPYWGHEPRE